MTQEERWLTRYNELMGFLEENHRNPSRHRIEEHDLLNWLKANRKVMNKGEMKEELRSKAQQSERRRQNFDMRTTPEDRSQRMLNVLEPGTVVPIHRHEDTSETVICMKGCLDVIFYNQQPDGSFEEMQRVSLNPTQGCYGVQIPKGAWHTVQVHEPSVIFEAKDGAYASTSSATAHKDTL